LYLRMGTLMLLPAGELVIESSSPSGDRLVRAYFIDPGAAGRTVVRAEVVGLDLGSKPRNIYLNEPSPHGVPRITWKSDTVVVIDGIEVNVEAENWDYRWR